MYFVKFVSSAPGGNGWCRASKDDLADVFCVSHATVKRMIKNLHAAGLIVNQRGSLQVTEIGLGYVHLKDPKQTEKPYQNDTNIEEKMGQNDTKIKEKTYQNDTKNGLKMCQNDTKIEIPPYSIKLRDNLSEKNSDFECEKIEWSRAEKNHVRKHVLKSLRKLDLPEKPGAYSEQVIEWLFEAGHQAKVTPYPTDFGIEKMTAIWVGQNVTEGVAEIEVGHRVVVKLLKLEGRQVVQYLRKFGDEEPRYLAYIATSLVPESTIYDLERQFNDPENKRQWLRFKPHFTDQKLSTYL